MDRDILDRMIAIETLMAARWERASAEFTRFSRELAVLERRFDQRFTTVEQLLKGSAAPTTSTLTLLTKDVRVLVIMALLAGAAMGKAGINPLDWFFG